MELKDKVVIVTGGAGGIGSALGRRFAAEGARAVVLADRDGARAEDAAAAIGPAARGAFAYGWLPSGFATNRIWPPPERNRSRFVMRPSASIVTA
jgi:NAD(P)-dependent dehydrogenase (short-subunit alcohol dehydrogenase family)